jgi:hypothetical protein
LRMRTSSSEEMACGAAGFLGGAAFTSMDPLPKAGD